MFISRSPSGPRIGVLVEQRYLRQAQPRGLVVELGRRGVDVRVQVADRLVEDLGRPQAADLDLVVARGRSAPLLALLRTLAAHGVPVLHGADSIASVVDKAGMAAVMSRAGIPTPRTWLGSVPELCDTADLPFPLVLKPLHGDNARGIRVVGGRRALSRLDWPEPVALAQPFHRGDGHDLKLYVAGSTVWAVRRPSPIEPDGSPRVESDPGVEVPVTAEMHALASACAAAFDLRLYGIDCLEVDGTLQVVEVNEYPNYRGLTRAADPVLGDVVLDVLHGPGRTGVPTMQAVAR